MSGGHWRESFDLLFHQSRLALPRGDAGKAGQEEEEEELLLLVPEATSACALSDGGRSRSESGSGMEGLDGTAAMAAAATTTTLPPRITIPGPLHFAAFPALLQGLEGWRLAAGLFDPVTLPGSLDGLDEEQITFLHADARKVAVSEWLKRSLQPELQRQLHALPSTGRGGAAGQDAEAHKLFLLLSGRQVKRALQEAMGQGNHHLAVLLAQLGGPSMLDEHCQEAPGGRHRVTCPTDANVLALLGKQLHIWRATATTGKPGLILSPWLEALYLLLAGDSTMWPASFFDLPSWRQILGCLLWYAAGSSAGLDEVLEAFEATFSAVPRAIPISPYARTLPASASFPTSAEGPVPLDVAFLLLRLHLRPEAMPLERVLELECNTRCPTDSSLSWFFAVVLGGSHATWAQPEKGDALARDFAWQLVCAGHWRWALYCAMHLRQATGRALLVQSILAHAVPWLREEAGREGELTTTTLHIPAAQVAEAQALYARDRGEVLGYIVHLLAAGHQSSAHRLLCTLLAPRLILDGRGELCWVVFFLVLCTDAGPCP